MKKVLIFVVVLCFFAINVYAADGDLNVMGNLGVGTTSPYYPLEINKANTTDLLIVRNAVDAYGMEARILMGPHPSSGGLLAGISGKRETAGNNINLLLYTGGDSWMAERLRILGSNGNVGIGTTNPVGKLDVNGSIYQRGGQLHADYVFEPDYKLESIKEHEEFMWKNKHLSAIPKAQKDADGQEIVEIGARNKGVVEELEKAHIYIVELYDEIQSLKETIAEIKSNK